MADVSLDVVLCARGREGHSAWQRRHRDLRLVTEVLNSSLKVQRGNSMYCFHLRAYKCLTPIRASLLQPRISFPLIGNPQQILAESIIVCVILL